MKLSISDRVLFMLRNPFPTKGSIITQTIARDAKNKLILTQEEMLKCGLKETDNGLKWSNNSSREIDFTLEELKLLKSIVEQLDKNEEITPPLLNMCVEILELELDGPKESE